MRRPSEYRGVGEPGTFVQIDESKARVADGAWRSEYERPIYFVETREGHICCWCSLQREDLVLQSHPLSPVPVRVLKHPQEAEVIGQVVGVAMRLGEWASVDALPEPRQSPMRVGPVLLAQTREVKQLAEQARDGGKGSGLQVFPN